MDYFYQKEDSDGIRFSVNVWPANKAEQAKMNLPLGCMYTPLKRGTHVQKVAYEPLQCKGSCRTYLNPYWCGFLPSNLY
jgi:protein transport protein SEC23